MQNRCKKRHAKSMENYAKMHLKWKPKSIKNRCKIDAGKRHAKSMENYAKMEPKWEPESMQNQKNAEKKHAENRC